jgi:hypothetical protein
MTIPGVDFAVAVGIIAAIGDVSRFRSAPKLGRMPRSSDGGGVSGYESTTDGSAISAHLRWSRGASRCFFMVSSFSLNASDTVAALVPS